MLLVTGMAFVGFMFGRFSGAQTFGKQPFEVVVDHAAKGEEFAMATTTGVSLLGRGGCRVLTG